LEPIGDGRYVFRQADSVLVNRSGHPVVIDFNPVEFAAEDFASIGRTVGAAKSVLGARP
jgi:hypothetical protein